MENRDNKYMLEVKNVRTIDIPEVTNRGLISRKNVYSKLPTVLAGEYAEVLSSYIDNNGNQAVVPPGWMVSKIREENTIFGTYAGIIIYRIPKEKAKVINWKDEDEVEGLRRIYDQLIWYPAEWFHETRDYESNVQKESINKYGGYYITCYDISRDKKTGNLRSVKNSYSTFTPINFLSLEEVVYNMEERETITIEMYEAEYDTREKNNDNWYRAIRIDEYFFSCNDYAVFCYHDADPCDHRFGSGFHAELYIK